MNIVADYFYRYPQVNLGVRGRCRVRIFEHDDGSLVVLLSELSSNAGESITSACASIATDLVSVKNLNPKRTRWIQQDLPHDGDEQVFDEIKFTWQNNEIASEPEWFTLESEQMETYTGSTIDELSLRLGALEPATHEEVDDSET